MTSPAVTEHPAGSYHNHGEAFTIPATVKVSQYTLTSVVLTAIEAGHHGIMYWCPKVRLGAAVIPVAPGEHYHEYLGRNVAHNGTVVFHVPEDGVTPNCNTDNVKEPGVAMHTLTRRKLLTGIGMAVANGYIKIESTDKAGNAEFDLDGPACDAILQYALFGQIVYA